MFTSLTIDSAFNGARDKKLLELLETGWFIYDKTLVNERYIHYILKKPREEQSCSD